MSAPSAPSAALVNRFRADVEALTAGAPDMLALAVSGGPDSLALLLLAHAAFPGRVQAATVDHGLRPEGAEEARFVAGLCERLGVAHQILKPDEFGADGASVQARARRMRYALLAAWAEALGGRWLATGHHLDDQAETILMRLNRAAGAAGLAGIRGKRRLQPSRPIVAVRPLLGWRRAELVAIVEAAGIEAVDDPSNRSPDYDRTHVRRLLAETPLLDPERLAASAAHLAESEEALAWVAEREWTARTVVAGEAIRIDTAGLPRELRRRLLVRAVHALRPDGEERRLDGISGLLTRLDEGETGTLAEIVARPEGGVWHLAPAPPRRPTR